MNCDIKHSESIADTILLILFHRECVKIGWFGCWHLSYVCWAGRIAHACCFDCPWDTEWEHRPTSTTAVGLRNKLLSMEELISMRMLQEETLLKHHKVLLFFTAWGYSTSHSTSQANTPYYDLPIYTPTSVASCQVCVWAQCIGK